MYNLYSPSKLLSLEDFVKLEAAFKKSWSQETVNPEIDEKWSAANPALGQCVPTALVVNDLYGGRLIYDKKNYHIWNELPDGSEQDFSRQQFLIPTALGIYKYKSRHEILSDETSLGTNLTARYNLLKAKIKLLWS